MGRFNRHNRGGGSSGTDIIRGLNEGKSFTVLVLKRTSSQKESSGRWRTKLWLSDGSALVFSMPKYEEAIEGVGAGDQILIEPTDVSTGGIRITKVTRLYPSGKSKKKRGG